MLQITITPSMLIFTNLPDATYTILKGQYHLEHNDKGHFIKGTQQQLFKVLLELSYTYDIELS